MSFLVVGGVTVPVREADTSYQEIGERERAFDGTMRSTIRARKRVWTVHTVPSAGIPAIYTALIAAPPVSCSGTLLGGAVNCYPEVSSRAPLKAANGVYESLSFSLHEA